MKCESLYSVFDLYFSFYRAPNPGLLITQSVGLVNYAFRISTFHVSCVPSHELYLRIVIRNTPIIL
jgi:hypothetical protein